jgi:hypothetical protein
MRAYRVAHPVGSQSIDSAPLRRGSGQEGVYN